MFHVKLKSFKYCLMSFTDNKFILELPQNLIVNATLSMTAECNQIGLQYYAVDNTFNLELKIFLKVL